MNHICWVLWIFLQTNGRILSVNIQATLHRGRKGFPHPPQLETLPSDSILKDLILSILRYFNAKCVKLTPPGSSILLAGSLFSLSVFWKHQLSEPPSAEEMLELLDLDDMQMLLTSGAERVTSSVCLRCISLLLRDGAAITSVSFSPLLLLTWRIWSTLCSKISTGFSLLLSKLLIANLGRQKYF